MRHLVIGIVCLSLLAVPTAIGSSHQQPLLVVADGEFFYDTNDDCVGDADDPNAENAVALRHWHVGLPFVGAGGEPAGGYGCLGGPATYDVDGGGQACLRIEGTIRYTWDTQVPGGGFNDIHLHVYDSAGDLVESTLVSNGAQPVVPMVLQVREHAFSWTVGGGTYTLVEDVFTGEHSAWLSNFEVTPSGCLPYY